MSVKLTSSGNWDNTFKFLHYVESGDQFSDVERYATSGVDALSNATPRESGETAESWGSKVSGKSGIISIDWTNSHVNEGVNVAVLIETGHGTGTGGFVPGRDYINPAIRPVMDKVVADVWGKVTRG